MFTSGVPCGKSVCDKSFASLLLLASCPSVRVHENVDRMSPEAVDLQVMSFRQNFFAVVPSIESERLLFTCDDETPISEPHTLLDCGFSVLSNNFVVV